MRIFVILAASALCIGAASGGQTVDDTYDFKPGDLVQFGDGVSPAPGSVWKVLRCDPATKAYRECVMVQQSPEAGREQPFTMYNYRKTMTLVGRAAATAPAAAPPAAAQVAQPRPPATAAPTAAQTVGGACPRSPYGGPVAGTQPASAALFRQKITDSITMGNTPRGWYGVTLADFRVGSPIRNGVGTLPGGGASRVNNGAPVGATMYPVSTTMTVCEGWNGGSGSWRTSPKKYLCFVSANREWTCGAST